MYKMLIFQKFVNSQKLKINMSKILNTDNINLKKKKIDYSLRLKQSI